MTFEHSAFIFPHVLYATSTRFKITPDSSWNSGTSTIDWLLTSPEKVFSDCESQCSKGNLSSLNPPIQETYPISLLLASWNTFNICFTNPEPETRESCLGSSQRDRHMVSFHGSSLNFFFWSRWTVQRSPQTLGFGQP
jgi:hypothetical protein